MKPSLVPNYAGLSAPDDPLPAVLDIDLGEEGELTDITIDPATGEIVIETVEVAGEAEAFGRNLVEEMTEEALTQIGADIVEKVSKDLEDRQPWFKRLKRGLENLGIYDAVPETGDAGIDHITHPLLLEAATQFQARTMAEIFPAKGPVKATIVGAVTEERVAQAMRVENHMNYQLTVEDRSYYDECDQKMFYLPFTGSEFDKQYHDPVTGRNVSRWVKSTEFAVPYNAVSLDTAERATHIIALTHNKLRQLQAAKFYRDVDLGEASDEMEDGGVAEQVDKMDGVVDTGAGSVERDHTLYETHLDYDLPGFEEDVARPYIITVDRDSRQVLAVYRNWRESDEKKERRCWFSHKKFLPGFGFYGFGLLHTIGGLSDAATRVLNILLDAGAFASLQGGFKSKDAKLKGDIELVPGEWKDCEMSAEELAKAFFTPPFKEPSPTLMNLLNLIQDLGHRFAATTEVMVGDAANTGPVGTTVAQIEQGSRVFSGIHKRIHKAMGDEFMHLAELNGEHLAESYPYEVEGASREVLKSDYDRRVDVLPVSDPNIFSSAQRIAQAQGVLQLSQQMPNVVVQREAARGLLESMRIPDPDRYVPEPAEAPYADPVTEGALVLVGRPIRAFPMQNHQAHSMVHQMQAMQLQQMNPQAAAAMQAHMQEHTAQMMVLQAQQQGIQMAPMHWGAKTSEPMAMSLPPEVENQIAAQAAQIAQQQMQQMQQMQAQQQAPEGEGQAAMAEVEQKGQAAQAKIAQDGQLKQAEIVQDGQIKQAEIAQKGQIAQATLAQEERLAQMEAAMKRMELEMEDRRKRDEAAAEIALKRELGLAQQQKGEAQ